MTVIIAGVGFVAVEVNNSPSLARVAGYALVVASAGLGGRFVAWWEFGRPAAYARLSQATLRELLAFWSTLDLNERGDIGRPRSKYVAEELISRLSGMTDHELVVMEESDRVSIRNLIKLERGILQVVALGAICRVPSKGDSDVLLWCAQNYIGATGRVQQLRSRAREALFTLDQRQGAT